MAYWKMGACKTDRLSCNYRDLQINPCFGNFVIELDSRALNSEIIRENIKLFIRHCKVRGIKVYLNAEGINIYCADAWMR